MRLRVTDSQFAIRLEIEPRLIGDDIKGVEECRPPLHKSHHAATHFRNIGDSVAE
jgi:hypothetical protein